MNAKQANWTHSGKKFIYDELKKMGIVPMSERGKEGKEDA